MSVTVCPFFHVLNKETGVIFLFSLLNISHLPVALFHEKSHQDMGSGKGSDGAIIMPVRAC